jgi:hypothetical protein
VRKIPVANPKLEQPPQTIIQVAPTFGNIQERAILLSQDIMQDLYEHGWREGDPRHAPPATIFEHMTSGIGTDWVTQRSRFFRVRFFQKVLDIRNEFAQLHLRDERLDAFFEAEGMIEQANKQMVAHGLSQTEIRILPQQIEEISERLKVLAGHVPKP